MAHSELPASLCVFSPSCPNAQGVYRRQSAEPVWWLKSLSVRPQAVPGGQWTWVVTGDGSDWLASASGGQWPTEASEWLVSVGSGWTADPSVRVLPVGRDGVAVEVGRTRWSSTDGVTWVSGGETWRAKTDKSGRRFYVNRQTGAKGWGLPDIAVPRARSASPRREPDERERRLLQEVEQHRRTIQLLEEKEAVYLAREEHLLSVQEATDPIATAAALAEEHISAAGASLQAERATMQQQVNEYYSRAASALASAQRELSERASRMAAEIDRERQRAAEEFAERERQLAERMRAADAAGQAGSGGTELGELRAAHSRTLSALDTRSGHINAAVRELDVSRQPSGALERERAEVRRFAAEVEEELQEIAVQLEAGGEERAATLQEVEGAVTEELQLQGRLQAELSDFATQKQALQASVDEQRAELQRSHSEREAEREEAVRALRAELERDLEQQLEAIRTDLRQSLTAAADKAREAEAAAEGGHSRAQELRSKREGLERRLIDMRVEHERDKAKLLRTPPEPSADGSPPRRAAEMRAEMERSQRRAAELRSAIEELSASRTDREAAERAAAEAERELAAAEEAAREHKLAADTREAELAATLRDAREAAKATARARREESERRRAQAEDRFRAAATAMRKDADRAHSEQLRMIREQAAAERQGLLRDRARDLEVADELLARTRAAAAEVAGALRAELSAGSPEHSASLRRARNGEERELEVLREQLEAAHAEAGSLRRDAQASRELQNDLRRQVTVARARGAQEEAALLAELGRARERLARGEKECLELRGSLRRGLHGLLDAELDAAERCVLRQPQIDDHVLPTRSPQPLPSPGRSAADSQSPPPRMCRSEDRSAAVPLHASPDGFSADMRRLQQLKQEMKERLRGRSAAGVG
eukprot:TRINITY_DN2871_c1_g4_i1.p1 TRINITY_DN2871_c1_g4~~TRINITY_DN2871_c1_g4_i1.p1  ORF type:complete len:909 (+),score=387.07 TRINITY_DN2871_c1_g4_i1:50-2728(+)